LLRKALHWFGAALGLAGVVFVGLKIKHQAGQIDIQSIEMQTWLALAALSVVYGAANTMLARAWWLLLKSLDVRPSWKWAVRVYGVSQLAKYVPGNIFQMAGRQAIAQADGHPGIELAKSTAYELVLVAAAGALFASLTLPLFVPALPVLGGLPVLLILVVLAGWIAFRWYGAAVLRALLWELGFFMVSALVFVLILAIVNPQAIVVSTIPVLCGAFVIAWLLGFLTPGSPAGIGVRESILLVLLGSAFPGADLLLAILLGRIVTMAGDLGFFAIAGRLHNIDKA